MGNLIQSSLVYITEESLHTNAFIDPVPRIEQAIRDLATEFTPKLINRDILREAVAKLEPRVAERNRQYDATVCKPDIYLLYRY